jgi:hypothetical protein
MLLSDWLPPLAAGLLFTALGIAKVYGQIRGIQGGGCKPALIRACGSCPSWSRSVNIAVTVFVLAIGLGNLAMLWWVFAPGPASSSIRGPGDHP